MKQCMDVKRPGVVPAKANRWRSDPVLLNQEAHELPPDKQREALDMVSEAAPELRAKLAPMWKYCFVQWHIYDAGLEAIEKCVPLREAFADEVLAKDFASLLRLHEGGDLDKAQTAEKWTWQLLEAMPPCGTADPWNDTTAEPMLKAARVERRQGVRVFAEEQLEQAFVHFRQGLKSLARAPPTVTGPHAKLRCDLYKNQAAVALRLRLNRTALRAATFAVAIDSSDPKAWYRKACALQAVGRLEEARAALSKADIAPPHGAAAAGGALQGLGAAHDAGEGLALDGERQEELPLRFHPRLEPLVFVEVGIDSILAIDMIRHIRAEIKDVPIPLTLVFECPTVEEAVTSLLQKLNAGEEDAMMRAKLNNTIWRSMCLALGTDPVRGVVDGRLGHVTWPEYSEQEAEAALLELKRAYEAEDFVQRARDLAKRVAFEQRPFLLNLRALALEVQRPILEARQFDGDAEGLRQLECALVSAAARSPRLRQLLREVRETQQGGPNGMWAINMDTNEVDEVFDCSSIQSWSNYMQADPFPGRKNTNAAGHGAAIAVA